MNFWRVSHFLIQINLIFGRSLSTEHAVLFLTTFVSDALDNGMKVPSVFLDIVKAFDCVDHFILIAELENCGFRGPFLELLSSFLKERTQYVQLGDNVSSVSNVKFGVPQGSVLGPLLFLVFVNDLCRAFNMISRMILTFGCDGAKVIIPSFADDTHLTVAAQIGIKLLSRISSCMEFV